MANRTTISSQSHRDPNGLVNITLGVVSIKQAPERKLSGSWLGLLAGLLLGVWAGPVGPAIGGSIVWLAGLIFDLVKIKVSAGFLDKASQAMPSENAALLVEITETSEVSVDQNLRKPGGHIFDGGETSLWMISSWMS